MKVCLFGQPCRKRSLGRPEGRWENIKTDLKSKGSKVWTGFNYIRSMPSYRILWTR